MNNSNGEKNGVENSQPVGNSSSQYNYVNIGILVSMGLKCIGLYPLIIKVAEKKTAEEISFVTPILFFLAFAIIFVISILKKFYIPAVLFFIGMVGGAILFVQKLVYHLSEEPSNNNNKQYYNEVKNYDQNIDNYKQFQQTKMPTSS